MCLLVGLQPKKKIIIYLYLSNQYSSLEDVAQTLLQSGFSTTKTSLQAWMPVVSLSQPPRQVKPVRGSSPPPSHESDDSDESDWKITRAKLTNPLSDKVSQFRTLYLHLYEDVFYMSIYIISNKPDVMQIYKVLTSYCTCVYNNYYICTHTT